MYLEQNAAPSDFVNCTIADNAAAGNVGGIYSVNSDTAVVRNCILWGNSGSQISSNQDDVEYSCIQGWSGGGTGNINENPIFQNGYRLSPGSATSPPSPALDAGNDSEIDDFDDDFDLDDNSTTAEVVPDLDFVCRIDGCAVDMGAFEYHSTCFADLNSDSVVNVEDLIAMLGAWGPNEGHPADLNDDDNVNVFDLLTMLGDWGPCECITECVESLQTELENSDLTWSDWEEFMALFMVEEPDEEEVALYVWWLHHYLSCHNNQTCPGVMGEPGRDPFGGH